MCGKNVERIKTEFEGRIIEQVTEFTYLRNMISE